MYTTIFHFIRESTRWTSSLVFLLNIFRFFSLKSIRGTIIQGTTHSGTHLHYFHSHSLFISIQSFINLHSTSHHITYQRNAEKVKYSQPTDQMTCISGCCVGFRFLEYEFLVYIGKTDFELPLLREAREWALNPNSSTHHYCKIECSSFSFFSVPCSENMFLYLSIK